MLHTSTTRRVTTPITTEPKELTLSPPDIRPEPDRWQFTQRGLALRLFITCWLVYGLHFATNTVREIYPALSLGDHLSFDVSEYRDFHPFDIFEVPGRGAFINNNPGASILGAIPYVMTRPVIDRIVEQVQRVRITSAEPSREYKTVYPLAREFYSKARERGLDVKFGLAAGVMQTLLMAPLSAVSVVLLFRIFVNLKVAVPAALFLALLYAFGTPVFYRTAQLNQNLLVSHFALFAFALLWRPWDDSSRQRRSNYFLAGLLSGWAVVLDYSGIVVVLALALYIFLLRSRRSAEPKSSATLLWYGSGVSCAIAVLFAYQWMSFGHPLYPAQYYMPPATYTHLGYRGMDWPRLDLLWETAFSLRFGLFTSAPLLLLALYVPGWFRGHRILDAPELCFVLVFCVLFFLFCAANQYGRMQFNTGVRHVVPVTPFLFLVVAGVMLRMPIVVASLIGIMSTYWSWCLAMYRDVEQGRGVIESIIHITFEGFRLPWLDALKNMGYFPHGTSALPLLFLLGTVLWVLWNCPTSSIENSAKKI
jgi:hypothetical protein